MNIRSLLQRPRRKVSVGRGRRLAFEGCERRELLSGDGLSLETPLFTETQSVVQLPGSFDLAGGGTLFGDWWDKGNPTQFLTLSYAEDGSIRFSVSDVALQSYAGADRDTDAVDEAPVVAGTSNSYLTITKVTPSPEIAPLPPFSAGSGATSKTGLADPLSAAETPLRAALAEFESSHGPADSNAGVSSASALAATTDSPRALSIGPADRVRFEQGNWDRAWAFEMAGFAAQAESGQESVPHFESAFRQFPSEIDLGLRGESATQDQRETQASLSAEEAGSTVAAILPGTRSPGLERMAASSTERASREARADENAIDVALAEDPATAEDQGAWWGAAIERHKELTATVVAAVIARQAWLHAKPTVKRDSAPELRPRRRTGGR
ncbi:hypothetical protein KOR34_26210 [Posidoniimonas corsicana]|uniref:Uncharacterized protein n=1 Tax=Posidoniimonas corsicana TaxID=1938618 RepID=A0A5C5VIY4_9BACT|nr:hypothetical protein [Posidoniimonas corsicana]TWT37662.1 hypothetical protein KOR34_26210 [Posidoniimonas corsicana]